MQKGHRVIIISVKQRALIKQLSRSHVWQDSELAWIRRYLDGEFSYNPKLRPSRLIDRMLSVIAARK